MASVELKQFTDALKSLQIYVQKGMCKSTVLNKINMLMPSFTGDSTSAINQAKTVGSLFKSIEANALSAADKVFKQNIANAHIHTCARACA